MRVSRYPDVGLPEDARPAVTLGNFDGVHRGHRRAIDLLVERARALGTQAIAVTFEPHPISVLRPAEAPKRILTPKVKEEILGAAGLDELVIIAFTLEFSRIEPREFVEGILVGRLRVRELVLGANFRFGRRRSGDLDSLRAYGNKHGFVVHEVDASMHRGEMISSSRIRVTLAGGQVDEAAAMLGRPYFLEGQVVEGAGRGRLMGFPTANLDVEGDVLVGDGVYVTDSLVNGRVYQGMTHVGRRPTFGIEERSVETHLFELDRNIYGSTLRLFFHERIRGTVRFTSASELESQLHRDREHARRFFHAHGRNLVL
ncbi:MAG TPA: bifunctional riboflavin kinase/FAD synthetase [Vicinamibacteria bacterium]|nr:bifunctional riboflavin kinase/FAD synthetase [Vicinamibacteria bacterium]